jgi:hypothetical protein
MEVDMAGLFMGGEHVSEGRPGIKWARQGRRIAMAATVSGLLALAVVPTAAQAQIFGMFGWSLAPGQVQHMIASQGYRLAGPLYRNGRVYVADVVDDRGVRQRLIVDAFSGDVLQAFVTGRPADLFGGERSARVEPLDRGVLPPTDSQPVKPKPKARANISKRDTVRARPEPDVRAPSADLPPSEATKIPAPLQSNEPVKYEPPKASEPSKGEVAAPDKSRSSEPAVAEPSPVPVKTPEASAKQQAKAPVVNEMPVAPLDDAAATKKPNRSATDVPVAPLD